MSTNFPPTLVYSWDYADSVFDLELLHADRLAKGWKLEGGPKAVYVRVGSATVIKHVQTYTRYIHQAVPRRQPTHATAESHAEVVAQRLSGSRPAFAAPTLGQLSAQSG